MGYGRGQGGVVVAAGVEELVEERVGEAKERRGRG